MTGYKRKIFQNKSTLIGSLKYTGHKLVVTSYGRSDVTNMVDHLKLQIGITQKPLILRT